jgi:hypothetical protein
MRLALKELKVCFLHIQKDQKYGIVKYCKITYFRQDFCVFVILCLCNSLNFAFIEEL